MAFDDGDTGRHIHNIIPKVSLQPINWTLNEVLFFTGHGPFPSFLQRLNLDETSFCSYGESAHQSIMLRFAFSQPPTIWHHTQPTTSTCIVPQCSQQFNVKEEDT
ncbi:hypothetical protein AVEN_12300-1 [Araneus ventricosus]|uniref:Uncharacterized protein n=1 Tax=Araneus ventricosus TaxID=182803 RepID=A0A4Y2EAN2_ARAVE|nr:hypothetical protein AVEN_12300-1 [Araneus ventricosus]